MQRAIPWIALLAAAGLVASAMILSGSPATNRQLAADRAQLRQLACAGCAVQRAWCDTGHLPNDNAALVDQLTLQPNCYSGPFQSCYANAEILSALAAKPPYMAREKHYRLCTHFAKDYAAQKLQIRSDEVPAPLRDYAAGDHCFTIAPAQCPAKK